MIATSGVAHDRRRLRDAGLALVLTLASGPAAAAPAVRVLDVPQDARECLRTSNAGGVAIRPACGGVEVLRCAYRTSLAPPAWSCERALLRASTKAWDAPGDVATIYLAACRPDAADCLDRQRWLASVVDGRRAMNLDVAGLVPPETPSASKCKVQTMTEECFVRRAPRG